MKKVIGIQGIQGSFHHLVAQQYYGEDVQVKECMSFQELVQRLVNDETQEAVMAIENSIAGSILPNYALIDENNLHVIGEHYIPIAMNMMALKGQKIDQITHYIIAKTEYAVPLP